MGQVDRVPGVGEGQGEGQGVAWPVFLLLHRAVILVIPDGKAKWIELLFEVKDKYRHLILSPTLVQPTKCLSASTLEYRTGFMPQV